MRDAEPANVRKGMDLDDASDDGGPMMRPALVADVPRGENDAEALAEEAMQALTSAPREAEGRRRERCRATNIFRGIGCGRINDDDD